MDNQHRLITGYRDLSQIEIDMMNRIKLAEAGFMELYREIEEYLKQQRADAIGEATKKCPPEMLEHINSVLPGDPEVARLNDAEPQRWLAIAKTQLQHGFMDMVRAVAQPAVPRRERIDMAQAEVTK